LYCDCFAADRLIADVAFDDNNSQTFFSDDRVRMIFPLLNERLPLAPLPKLLAITEIIIIIKRSQTKIEYQFHYQKNIFSQSRPTATPCFEYKHVYKPTCALVGNISSLR